MDAGYGDGVVRQDATFVSPFADALPEESRLVRFARLRPGAPPTSGTDGAASAVKRIAVLLPCTGDVDEWFRRSIARELLTNGVECVIPTIAYYGERKPARAVATRVAKRRRREDSAERDAGGDDDALYGVG